MRYEFGRVTGLPSSPFPDLAMSETTTYSVEVNSADGRSAVVMVPPGNLYLILDHYGRLQRPPITPLEFAVVGRGFTGDGAPERAFGEWLASLAPPPEIPEAFRRVIEDGQRFLEHVQPCVVRAAPGERIADWEWVDPTAVAALDGGVDVILVGPRASVRRAAEGFRLPDRPSPLDVVRCLGMYGYCVLPGAAASAVAAVLRNVEYAVWRYGTPPLAPLPVTVGGAAGTDHQRAARAAQWLLESTDQPISVRWWPVADVRDGVVKPFTVVAEDADPEGMACDLVVSGRIRLHTGSQVVSEMHDDPLLLAVRPKIAGAVQEPRCFVLDPEVGWKVVHQRLLTVLALRSMGL